MRVLEPYRPRETDAWHAAVAGMAAWAAEHGSTYPPAGTRLADGRDLTRWAANTRAAHTAGDLTATRAADCETRIPGWQWRRLPRPRRDAGQRKLPFAQRVARLAAWTAATGRLPAAADADNDGYGVGQLAKWLRAAHADGRLPPAQVAAVEAAVPGWAWQALPRDVARARAGRRQWQAACGRFAAAVADGFRDPVRDSWARLQRRRRGQLSREQRASLEAVPGWDWTPAGTAWAAHAADVAALIAAHGRLPRDAAEPTLAEWWRQQTHRAAAGTLTPGQAAIIANHADAADLAVDAAWEREAGGIARRREAGTGLDAGQRAWLAAQRARLRQGRLTPDQAVRLAGLAVRRSPRANAARGVAFGQANSARTAAAAGRRAAAAAAVLASPPPGIHAVWVAVLRARVDQPGASLAELAAAMGMTKDQYAALLRRALDGTGPAAQAS